MVPRGKCAVETQLEVHSVLRWDASHVSCHWPLSSVALAEGTDRSRAMRPDLTEFLLRKPGTSSLSHGTLRRTDPWSYQGSETWARWEDRWRGRNPATWLR